MSQPINSQRSSTDWFKQHYVAWTIERITGAHPSSLALVNDKHPIYAKRFLCWEDVEFMPNLDGTGLAIRLTLQHMKGFADPHKANQARFRPRRHLVKSCRFSWRLPADLPWPLLSLAYERGVFVIKSVGKPLHDLSLTSTLHTDSSPLQTAYWIHH